MRLTSGVCAGIDGLSVLTGDQYLRRRPMERIAAPLRMMGAAVDGRERGNFAPLVIRGGGLQGITYAPKEASAQPEAGVAGADSPCSNDHAPVAEHTRTAERHGPRSAKRHGQQIGSPPTS
ncbi:hypothetical protein [Streptomyces sp. NPDC005538]|uniref:hypothetical protein n=1 Tax=Streptomyces sp. NPDC005538 TaxID=3157043 RepID=UPI0033BDA470